MVGHSGAKSTANFHGLFGLLLAGGTSAVGFGRAAMALGAGDFRFGGTGAFRFLPARFGKGSALALACGSEPGLQFVAEERAGAGAVLRQRPFLLTTDFDTRGQMPQPHGRGGLVHFLSAVPAAAHKRLLQIPAGDAQPGHAKEEIADGLSGQHEDGNFHDRRKQARFKSKNPLAADGSIVENSQYTPLIPARAARLTPPTPMNSPNAFPRVAATMLAAALTTAGSVDAAPQKPNPAPAVQSAAVPEKKGMLTKAKELIGFKAKEKPAEKTPDVPASRPAAKAKLTAETKSQTTPAKEPVVKAGAVPAEKSAAKKQPKPAVAETAPEKKGWIKGLFSKSSDQTPAEPALARAKTAKPAPVKEVKPAKENEKLTAGAEPEQKRGIFGLLRKFSEPIEEETGVAEVADEQKIERPADWQEHRIVKSDEIALYSYGPSQANGPDARLQRGTAVKVMAVKKGWALVEVKDGVTGYMDASMLREAAKTDFKDPPPLRAAMAAVNPDLWAPLAPPPDLPDSPSQMDSDAALLLLPPLELEQKPNP